MSDPRSKIPPNTRKAALAALLLGAATGTLDRVAPPSFADAAVCVVLASGGYPRSYAKGLPIDGLDAVAGDPDVAVFHAGTKREGDRYVTAGGRVLGVTARADSVANATRRAYAAVDRIHFEGMHFRRDIAARALER